MIETNIRCDNCGNLGISDYGVNRKNAYCLRAELKKLGWSNIGGEDYCPLCQAGPRNKMGFPELPKGDKK